MAEIYLNNDQKQAVNLILSGLNAFIGGRAGTGKTFTTRYILKLTGRQKNVVITCTTGIACTLYGKSTTLHSFAGLKNLRLNLDALTLSVTSNEECLKRWLSANLLALLTNYCRSVA